MTPLIEFCSSLASILVFVSVWYNIQAASYISFFGWIQEKRIEEHILEKNNNLKIGETGDFVKLLLVLFQILPFFPYI